VRISGSGGGHNEDDLGHSGESMARFSDFVELESERQQISALLGIFALKYFFSEIFFSLNIECEMHLQILVPFSVMMGSNTS
jgi:hypothetical protein